MDSDFFKRNKKQLTKIVVITIIVLFLYRLISNWPVTLEGIKKFFTVVRPFILAGILAYLLYFPCNYFEKKVFGNFKSRKAARVLSIVIVYIIFFLITITVIIYLIPIVFDSMIEISKNIPIYVETVRNLLLDIPEDSILSNLKLDLIVEKAQEFTGDKLETEIANYFDLERILGFTNQAINFGKTLIQLLMTFAVSVYMLFERESIAEYFKRFLEANTRKKTYLKVISIVREANDIFRKYITSQFIDAFIVGVIMIIALLLFKVKYAVFLGFLIGLFNLIPFFGALTAGLITVLMTIITGGVDQGLKTGVIILVLQQIDANILQPKIVGEHLQVSRILIISATTLGGAYFGVWGMFFGVPVLTTIKAVMDNITESKIKQNKIRRLINKRLLIRVKKPNKNTLRNLKIRRKQEA